MKIWDAFNPYYQPESVPPKGFLALQREITLQFLLDIASLFGVVGWIANSSSTSLMLSALLPLALLTLSIAILAAITASRKLPYDLRAGILVGLITVGCLFSIFQDGLNVTGMAFLVTLVASLSVLFNPWAGFVPVAGLGVTASLVYWAMVSGRLPMPQIISLTNTGLTQAWVSNGIAMLFAATSISAILFQMMRGLATAIGEQTKLDEELIQQRNSLEIHVEKRTQELSRKTTQLEAARQVTTEIASATDRAQALSIAVQEIRQQFNYLQVSIFMNDVRNEFAILDATTGEAGQQLVESGFRVKVGGESVVGLVASTGKPIITSKTDGSMSNLTNHLLTKRQADFAVPIFSDNRVAGVLYVQSDSSESILVEDIDILTSLASQVSQSIEKASMLDTLKHRTEELEASSSQSTRSAWESHLSSSRRGYAFRYRQTKIEKTSSHSPEVLQALKQGTTVMSSMPVNPSSEATQPFATLAVPIKIRNQTLGVIHLRVAGMRISPELTTLVEGAVTRLAASLDNARLMEELQNRAARERLVGEIASKVRNATDIDSILRTTAAELGHSFGLSEVVIELNTLK